MKKGNTSRVTTRLDRKRGLARGDAFDAIESAPSNGLKTERGKLVSRTYGLGKRSYGYINLKVDQSQYLSPNDHLDKLDVLEAKAIDKFENDLKDLAQTHKGCIIWYTLEYFEKSNDIRPYVESLLAKCLNNEFIMEATTKNFVALSNIKYHGESIKRYMLNCLIHIHEDLLNFGLTDNTESNPQLYLQYYSHNIAVRYYRLVHMLFFRFRKHLDSYERYEILASPALSGLSHLLDDGDIDSVVLLARFIQLNFHCLNWWFRDEMKSVVHNIIAAWKVNKAKDKIKYIWYSGILDIIYQGPILTRTLYKRYEELLGAAWKEVVGYPPVQVLQPLNEFLISEKLDCFYITDDDIFRNMFVNLE